MRNTDRAFCVLLPGLMCSPHGWRPVGTEAEECFRLILRRLRPLGLQESCSTTAACCSNPLHPQHCQHAKKTTRYFFVWHVRSEHTLLADGYFGVYCTGSVTFSFRPQLEPARRFVTRQPKAGPPLMRWHLRAGAGVGDRNLLTLTLVTRSGCCISHFYLYWHPTVRALSESQIKSHRLRDSADVYSCPDT